MNALRTTSRFRLTWQYAVLLAALLLLATHALAQSPPAGVGAVAVTRSGGNRTVTWDAHDYKARRYALVWQRQLYRVVQAFSLRACFE